jgi:hypothetical protein
MLLVDVSWTGVRGAVYGAAMPGIPSGHVEQLLSGSWHAKVYAGKDPLTGREIRFRKTPKSELAAQMEVGNLLALAQAGRQPDSCVTVAQRSASTFRPPGGICPPGRATSGTSADAADKYLAHVHAIRSART